MDSVAHSRSPGFLSITRLGSWWVIRFLSSVIIRAISSHHSCKRLFNDNFDLRSKGCNRDSTQYGWVRCGNCSKIPTSVDGSQGVKGSHALILSQGAPSPPLSQ